MDFNLLGLFALGALGALVIVYVAKQEAIPEFRAAFDTIEKETELTKRLDHIHQTQMMIDQIQNDLRLKKGLKSEETQRLTTVLTTSQDEIHEETTRVEVLERDIKQSQIFSRVLGFIIYIGLGGTFSALLTGHVHVDGVGAGLPTYFESILIGATWTTYLSTIGFKLGQQKAQLNADDRIEALKNEFNQQLQELKKNLIPQVKDTVEIAEKSDKVEKPALAPGVESSMGSAIDDINTAIQSQTNLTRQMIRKDFMRI